MSFRSSREGERDLKFLSENTVSIPLLQARLRGLYSPWTLSVCQTSLGLAQEAQLIGLWGPPSMLILLEAVCACVCVAVVVVVCVQGNMWVCSS